MAPEDGRIVSYRPVFPAKVLARKSMAVSGFLELERTIYPDPPLLE
jgi:hypothetical protein